MKTGCKSSDDLLRTEEIENKIKAKIPGEDTGIEVKKTFCDICTPTNHCGIDVYVKDGTVLKIEGTQGHPMNQGRLCTKGACNRAYIYRQDRLKTPLRRIGRRGEGKFEEISWEEAFDEAASKMLNIKEQYGPNSVAFYSGYPKSYRCGCTEAGCSGRGQGDGLQCERNAFRQGKSVRDDAGRPCMSVSRIFGSECHRYFV